MRAFAFFALILLQAACRTQNPEAAGVSVQFHLRPSPPRVGLNLVELRLKSPSKPVLTGADVTLETNMSHPGMSPGKAQLTEFSPGLYLGPVEFTMAGDWVVTVHGKLPGNQRFERTFDVKGVRDR